jgi:inosine-uridine nucleoside N-ribohydrolase
MVPLEVTHTALVTNKVIENIGNESKFFQLMTELLVFFKSMYKDYFGMEDPPLHDPCAVALIVRPDIFEYKEMRVDIELNSELSYGQTVCDFYNMSKKKKNCFVCLKMDTQQFFHLLTETLKKVDKNSLLNKQY